MQRWLGAIIILGVASGCWGSSGNGAGAGGGTTNAAAALALTKAVSFTGGTLLNGAVPNADTTDVSLIPASGQMLLPGDTSLLGFDIDDASGGNDPASSALLQFEDAPEHFSVNLDSSSSGGSDASTAAQDSGSGSGVDAGGGSAGSGGGSVDAGTTSGTPGHRMRHVSLQYKLAATVCDQLCDTTFSLKLVQAVKLKSGHVSSHAQGSVELDCTTKGDHSRCATRTDTSTAGVGDGKGSAGTGASCSGTGSTPVNTGMPSACVTCLQTNCGIDSCYGPNWQSGDFSGGVCGPFYSCAMKCSCSSNSPTCAQGCTSSYTAECGTCSQAVSSCETGTCASACGTSGTGTGGASGGAAGVDAGAPNAGTGGGTAGATATGGPNCARLSGCCASLPASYTSSCDTLVTSGDDATCAQGLSSFMSAGYCGGAVKDAGAGGGGTAGVGAPAFDAGVPAAGAGG